MGDDYLSLLSPNDLAGFNQSVQASDPYGLIGKSLMDWQPNYSSFNAGESALTAFGKAFMGGLMQNYAQNRAADQVSKVVNILPQLRSDPLSVAAPEGVDLGSFNMLRGSAILKNEALKETNKTKDENRISSLLGQVLPDMIKARTLSAKDALSLATSEDPREAFLGVSEALDKPTASKIPAILDNQSPLATGKQATSEKLKTYYQEFLSSGLPPVQAASAAKQQIEGELKANNKSFDEAKASRETAQKLMTMAQTAESGMASAGQTGSELASAYEQLVSTLSPVLPGSQSEAKAQAAGDALLSSIRPEAFVAARPPGIGAMSDSEMRQYLKTAPGTDKTPEQNAVLINRIKKVAALHSDYADFMDAYREANSGSTIGADKKWMEYRNAVPLFDPSGELKDERLGWQEYFAAKGAQESENAISPEAPSKQTLKSEAQALAAQGKSKEEIAAYLRSKYGG